MGAQPAVSTARESVRARRPPRLSGALPALLHSAITADRPHTGEELLGARARVGAAPGASGVARSLELQSAFRSGPNPRGFLAARQILDRAPSLAMRGLGLPPLGKMDHDFGHCLFVKSLHVRGAPLPDSHSTGRFPSKVRALVLDTRKPYRRRQTFQSRGDDLDADSCSDVRPELDELRRQGCSSVFTARSAAPVLLSHQPSRRPLKSLASTPLGFLTARSGPAKPDETLRFLADPDRSL